MRQHISTFVVLSSFLSAAFSAPSSTPRPEDAPRRNVPRDHIRHEWHVPEHTEGWTRRGRADPQAWLPVRIGLTQSNLDKAEEMLIERSHPTSSKYGKHLSAEEVLDIFAPAEDAVATVRSWLKESGVAQERISISPNKQWIQFDAQVREVERIFHAQYDMFEHDESGVENVGCTESVEPFAPFASFSDLT